MSGARTLVCLLVAVALAGCASRPINEPITQVDPKAGYRPYLLIPKRQNNDPHTLFVLSFSGGGTRAAAFSYGVLEELRRTEIVVDGQRRRLIDEVDVITGVSGGASPRSPTRSTAIGCSPSTRSGSSSATCRARCSRALNPFNWPKFIGGSAGRSELAAEYYDEILFEGATFGDLLDKQAPVAIATGTDISTGSRLAFFQQDFDLLCSDLNKVRLSRAAATSSAVPVVLSPVTFNNYGGTCGYQYPAWVRDVANPRAVPRPAGRAVQRYREMQDFQNSKDRPYIHLVDGGVADNIGVRGVLETLEELAASAAFRDEVGFGGIRRIVLIVVNARSSPRTDWDRSESPPGFVVQLLQASSVPIDRYSFETIETMKDRAGDPDVAARAADCAGAPGGRDRGAGGSKRARSSRWRWSTSASMRSRPEGARLLHEPADELRAAGRRTWTGCARSPGELLRQSQDFQSVCASSAGRRRK